MTRPLRIGALWLAAVALAGGAAYLGVTAELQSNRGPSQARKQLEDARRIARYAENQRALLGQIAGRREGPVPRLTGPMLAELRAKVRQTQQEILRAQLDGPAYDALLVAADRLAACAAAPQNEALRNVARRAQDELETLLHAEIQRLERAVKRERRD